MKTEKTQEKVLTNIEKLIAIQNELKVPKGNLNKFGNYKYRSAEDILEALKPILFKYSALLRLSDKVVQIGNKSFVKATARIIVGDFVDFAYGYAELCEHKGMSAEQATGTASSYARKYALNGLFLIDETEQDADHDNKKVEQKKPELILNSEVYKKAQEYMMSGGSIDVIKQKYSVSQEVEVALIKSI
jgi:hypothetical protein